MFGLFPFINVIIGLSLLIFIHEAGHFFAAKWSGLLVEEFGFGIPPRLWSKKIGETVYSLNWLPFGGFVKIYGEHHFEEKANIDAKRSFSHQKIWKRAMIIIFGVLMNFLLGWFLISIVFMVGTPQTLAVVEVKEGSVAEKAGIIKGDQVVNFKKVSDLVKILDAHKGEEIILKIRRDNKDLEIKAIPRLKAPAGEGYLGVYLEETGLPKFGFFQGICEGLIFSLKALADIVSGFFNLFIGIFSGGGVLKNFIGPIGIVELAIKTSKSGLAYFIQLLSLISLNLAVFNVIPIPALDGGKLLFLAIEKARGKRVSIKTEMAVTGISFIFLLALILLVTAKDIWSLR